MKGFKLAVLLMASNNEEIAVEGLKLKNTQGNGALANVVDKVKEMGDSHTSPVSITDIQEKFHLEVKHVQELFLENDQLLEQRETKFLGGHFGRSKRSNPFAEFIVGILMIMASIPMTWLNERKKVKMEEVYDEAA